MSDPEFQDHTISNQILYDKDGYAVEVVEDGGIRRLATDAVVTEELPAGSNVVGKVQIRDPGDTVDLGDATNPVRTDPTGNTAQPVTDNGGSLSVDDGGSSLAINDDNGSLTVDDGGVSLAVNDDGGSITVDDGGGSLTVDGTVTANVGTTGGLALDATLTDGSQKSIVRGGAKGSTAAADVTSTASGANHQPLDVAIYDASGNQITDFDDTTQYDDGDARGSATGTLAMVDDGTNIQSAAGDSDGRQIITQKASTAAVTSVAKSVSSVQILAANTDRLGATVHNDSNKTMYLKFGTAASTTSFTVKIDADFYYEVPFGYTGIMHAVWDAGGSGSARITEITS